MDKIKCVNYNDLHKKHKAGHKDYEYIKRSVVPVGSSGCTVSFYEIPCGKSAYPYHYHTKNEEVFYIISGEGLLRTPDGDKKVTKGDIMFFPANMKGAHKLTNVSENEPLVYLDVDTHNDLDVAFYPDSKKMGVFGKEINKIYKIDSDVDYYDGE